MEIHKQPQAHAQTDGHSSKFDRGLLLTRTTSTQLIDHREVELVPAWSLQNYALVFLA